MANLIAVTDDQVPSILWELGCDAVFWVEPEEGEHPDIVEDFARDGRTLDPDLDVVVAFVQELPSWDELEAPVLSYWRKDVVYVAADDVLEPGEEVRWYVCFLTFVQRDPFADEFVSEDWGMTA